MSDDYEPAAHYDRVTEAWGLLLGDELHYGVFDQGDETLTEATNALTARMVAAADLSPGLRVLDIGCGTGAPACQLAEEHGVEVVGITTSPVGIAAATERAAARGLSASTSFELRDGTDTGLPDASFDRVWCLEASHLMPRRDLLIAESARLLRPGGRLVLCDIMRLRTIPFDELRRRTEEFAVLRAAFGNARMDSQEEYSELAEANGLVVDHVENLSAPTRPTFQHWLDNADKHEAFVVEAIGADGLEDFRQASRVLDALWGEDTLGYGLFSAYRPQ